MTERLKKLYDFILTKQHHQYRRDPGLNLADFFASEHLSPGERVTRRLVAILAAQTPVILPGEKISFLRTTGKLPPIFTDDEMEAFKKDHFIHELGFLSNIPPDYGTMLAGGLLKRRRECLDSLASHAGEAAAAEFLSHAVTEIDAVLDLARRYSLAAAAAGDSEQAEILERVPREGAKTFREALQFLRILHFTLWCEGVYHNVFGRFDQYLRPWFEADLAAGRLDAASALDLVEEFFLTCNRDSDLYPGVQQGDNGQSLILGGTDAAGNDSFYLLSELCLQASGELLMIDPKINVRVSKQTPLGVYEQCTRLTRAGLGFPQYNNDDVVIPGLVKLGYAPEDARNYAVAACWEFMIPGLGADVPNIGALNFPEIVNRCTAVDLAAAPDFPAFMASVGAELSREAQAKAASVKNLMFFPSPFLSILLPDCVERGRDFSQGSRYNNYGFHGVGIATAVDALAAIQKYVFEDRTLTPVELQAALDADYEGYDDLFDTLRHAAPKFGRDDPAADAIACELLASYAAACKPLRNDRGGCFRAGTGTAMYYLWYSAGTGATAGGHRRGEAYSADYSPDLAVKTPGPLSVIRSLTQPHLEDVINGGPMTLELHSSVFRDEASISKVAGLVRTFILLGGHQFQLNAVNRETMLDAQKHPERYTNLIVRVWGWSAYFVELDKGYQDHVISRTEYVV